METTKISFVKNEGKTEPTEGLIDFEVNMKNALSEVELGIGNNYFEKMQAIDDQRKEILKNKEMRRRQMAKHRFTEAMVEKAKAQQILSKTRARLHTVTNKKG